MSLRQRILDFIATQGATDLDEIIDHINDPTIKRSTIRGRVSELRTDGYIIIAEAGDIEITKLGEQNKTPDTGGST